MAKITATATGVIGATAITTTITVAIATMVVSAFGSGIIDESTGVLT